MKRTRAASSGDQPAKRRKVKHETYKYQTVTWLDCDTGFEDGVKVVTKLKCRMCTKYRQRIVGRKNFSDKWINGADSIRTANVTDHAKSDQHVRDELAQVRASASAWC